MGPSYGTFSCKWGRYKRGIFLTIDGESIYIGKTILADVIQELRDLTKDEIRDCKYCDKTFVAHRNDMTYCSEFCRDLAYKQTRKERRG